MVLWTRVTNVFHRFNKVLLNLCLIISVNKMSFIQLIEFNLAIETESREIKMERKKNRIWEYIVLLYTL